jgi:PD-(D/E)XK nuclease superfamily
MNWSYSSLSLYRQCPHKFYRLRVLKDIPREPDSPAILYGTAFHEAAELFVRDGVALPEQFAKFKPLLESLMAATGTRYCEYSMGLREDFTPCGFYDKDMWARGTADLLIINGNTAKVVDYKTGAKSTYADTKQLELMALMVFKHFPEVKRVNAGLLFVVCNDFVKAKYSADKSGEYWMYWLPDVQRLETAYETNVWPRKQNFTCKNYCPVLDCLHNGRP